MGMLIKDDQYVGTLLDLLNVRFAPISDPNHGPDGIVEIADIQKRFKIFETGRSLKDSAAIMNLGGFWNTKLKNNWFNYIDSLSRLGSDDATKNGSERIVGALIDNLESTDPMPVHFTFHDFDTEKRVLVTKGKPLVYMSHHYMVVSLPLRAQNGPSGG